VINWTSVTPASSTTIEVPGTLNGIIDEENDYETRQLLVEIDAGLSSQTVKAATWKVQNNRIYEPMTNFNEALQVEPYYPITAAEIAAGVTPTDYNYPQGNVLRYGTNIDQGTTDMTAAFQAAIDSHGLVIVPAGTYLVTGLTLAPNCTLIGEGITKSIIILGAAANDHVLYGEDVTDVILRDFKIDGNKSNQSTGTGNNWRGLYLLGDCHRIRIDNVLVTNIVDHGVFFANGGDANVNPGKDSLITGLIVTNCGSAAHTSGGGAGGTGIAGGCNSTTFVGCYATGNYLNGFKSWGEHFGCHSYDNTGGGFETGFSTPELTQVRYVSCRAYSNDGDGFRNQGQIDEITFVGCEARNNDNTGIMFLNTVNKATITGCWLVNNGQDRAAAARSDTVCYDGIAFTATSGTPQNITISGCQFFDDQGGSATQEYHVYVRDPVTNVSVEANNIFGSVRNQVTYVEALAVDSTVTFRDAPGLAFVTKSTDSIPVTGTVNATDMHTITIPAFSLNVGTSLRIIGRGTATGTNNTKTIRLDVNGTTAVMSSQAAGDQQVWAAEARIYRSSSSLLTIAYTGYEVGGQISTAAVSVSVSTSTDLTIKFTGQLGNASDTITQNYFAVGTTD